MSHHKFFVATLSMVAVLITIFLILLGRANAQMLVCSAGSYDAGGFCKNEPTGCPYGDSIPVDSPKCVAPVEPTAPSITAPAENDIAPVITEENWGK